MVVMLRGLDAIFCDMDGTLVSSFHANFAAYRSALATAGVEITEPEFRQIWGEDSRDFIPRLFPQLTEAKVSEIRATKAEIFGAFTDKCELNQPLVELLGSAQSGTKIGLVTSAKASNVRMVLELHSLTTFFDFVVTGDDVEKGKPAPDPYLRALALSGTEASKTVAIEDSEAGLLSAMRAGVTALRIAPFEGELP